MNGAPSAPDDAAILDAVRGVWGFDTLRPLQREAISATLAGRDSLVVLPTGGGKSLCYQVPPLVSGRLAIVVSPLISLMNDQVHALRLNAYPAAALHSMCSPDEVRRIDGDLAGDRLRLLLVAPERAMTPAFLERLSRAGVGSIAIDEAHCISHWGHDFRPEYRRLSELRERFPGVPFQALTATATPRVREDIARQLHLRDPAVLVGVFDRPNLTYRVVGRTAAARQLAEAIRGVDESGGGAAIIYALSRRDTESISESLKALGIGAECYHAGLETERRRDVQDRFAREELNVVVATVAFGMGIDRPDVRLVAHACMPRSVESYQQETGRAGRDGLPAECLMLYSPSDAARWKRLIATSSGESEPDAEFVAAQSRLVDQMRAIASSAICRHRALSEHFGQAYARDDCGACDVCLGEAELAADSTTIARKILSAVARTGQRSGAAHVADVLCGRATQRVVERGHDRLSTFGILSECRRMEVLSYIDQLVALGVLERGADKYQLITFGRSGRRVMRGEEGVALRAVQGRSRRGAGQPQPLGPDEMRVFERLRTLRKREADRRGVAPFVIFNDATLRMLASVRPSSPERFLRIHGIGRRKAEEFGERFLAEIRAGAREFGLGLDGSVPGSSPRP